MVGGIVSHFEEEKVLALAAGFLVVLFFIGFLLQPQFAVVSDVKQNFTTTLGRYSSLRIGSDRLYFRGTVYSPSEEVIGFKTFFPDPADATHLLIEGTSFTPEEKKFIETFAGPKYLISGQSDVEVVNQQNPLRLIHPLSNYRFLFIIEWLLLIAFLFLFFLKIKPLPSRPLLVALAVIFSISLPLALGLPKVFGDEAFTLSDYSISLQKEVPLLDALGHLDLFFYPTYIPFFFFFGEIDGFRIHTVFLGSLAVLATFLLAREWIGQRNESLIAASIVALPFFLVFASTGVYRGGLSLLFYSLFLLAMLRVERNPWYLLFAGVFAGVASRTYPIMSVLPVVYVIMVFAVYRRLFFTRPFFLSLILSAIFILPVASFYATHDPFLSAGYAASKSEFFTLSRSIILGGFVLDQLAALFWVYVSSALSSLAVFLGSFVLSTPNVPLLFSFLTLAGLIGYMHTRGYRQKNSLLLIIPLLAGLAIVTFFRAENVLPPTFILAVLPLALISLQGLTHWFNRHNRTWILALALVSFGYSLLVFSAMFFPRPAEYASEEITQWVAQNYLQKQEATIYLHFSLDRSFFYHLRSNPRIITVGDYYYFLYRRVKSNEFLKSVKKGDVFVSVGPSDILHLAKIVKVFGQSANRVIVYEFT